MGGGVCNLSRTYLRRTPHACASPTRVGRRAPTPAHGYSGTRALGHSGTLAGWDLIDHDLEDYGIRMCLETELIAATAASGRHGVEADLSYLRQIDIGGSDRLHTIAAPQAEAGRASSGGGGGGGGGGAAAAADDGGCGV